MTTEIFVWLGRNNIHNAEVEIEVEGKRRVDKLSVSPEGIERLSRLVNMYSTMYHLRVEHREKGFVVHLDPHDELDVSMGDKLHTTLYSNLIAA